MIEKTTIIRKTRRSAPTVRRVVTTETLPAAERIEIGDGAAVIEEVVQPESTTVIRRRAYAGDIVINEEDLLS